MKGKMCSMSSKKTLAITNNIENSNKKRITRQVFYPALRGSDRRYSLVARKTLKK